MTAHVPGGSYSSLQNKIQIYDILIRLTDSKIGFRYSALNDNVSSIETENRSYLVAVGAKVVVVADEAFVSAAHKVARQTRVTTHSLVSRHDASLANFNLVLWRPDVLAFVSVTSSFCKLAKELKFCQ